MIKKTSRYMLLLVMVVLAQLLLINPQASAEEFIASMDKQVDNTGGATSYSLPGNGIGLCVGYNSSTTTDIGNERAALQFNIPTAAIETAKLRIYIVGVNVPESAFLKLYGSTDDTWNEAANTSMPSDETLIGTYSGTDIAKGWREFDVTSFVKNQQQAGDYKASFLLIGYEGGGKSCIEVMFNSREQAGSEPRLVITPLPEIDIMGNSTSIPDGDTSPRTSDDTDFGSTDIATGSVNKTYTIYNTATGSSNLTVGDVSITGDGFTLVTAPAATVAAGGSTTFTVKFDPSSEGEKTGTISIVNGDSDENPYDFTIKGTGTVSPEMGVKGNGTSIDDGDDTPAAADDTDFGATDVDGGSIVKTFTIANTGSAVLNLSGGTPVTVDNADFTITQATANTVAALTGEITFQVTFNPTAAGERTATISIANDDSNENPYTFKIKGTGAVPEIDVKGASTNSITDGDTACGTDDTNFGNADIATGEVTKTFTIYNGGNGTLKLIGDPLVNKSGAGADAFTITQPANTDMAGNISTTFTVKFNPATTGEKTATLSITNNDSDEGTYDFGIKGTGTAAPEMDVKGKGTSIASGDMTPDGVDDTHFSLMDVNGVGIFRIFTIVNTGSAELTLTGTAPALITVGGVHPGDFKVTRQPDANKVAALGGTKDFKITFDPSAAGERTAIISIANDDSNEPTYTFMVAGIGLVPDIDVKGNSGNSITDGDTACGTDDTNFGNADIATGEVTKTFTIYNDSVATLDLSGDPLVDITGADKANFTITQPDRSFFPGKFSTTFTIKFNPDTTGVKTATISILNNDSDETPYDFAIQGTGTASPEMGVKGNGTSIDDGDDTPAAADDTDFGATDVDGGSIVKTFTIANTGSAVLNLNGGTPATVDNADFTITQPTANTVAALTGEITFQVTFNPTAAGERTATISIANDDSNENPFDFSIKGVGAVPEIDLKGNSGASITDGDTACGTDDTNFGNADIATGEVTKTFTIYNGGNGTLKLNGTDPVSITGAGADAFTITQPNNKNIPGNISTTFTVKFNPATTGEKTATLSIINNDSDEGTYDFSIKGTGTAVPEIDVKGNSNSIANGDTTPDMADDTDFGATDVDGGIVVKTFTIVNTGSAELTLTGTAPALVTVGGDHLGDFTVTRQPDANKVAALGGTKDFQITFDPSAAGERTAIISIANDDSNETPYTFKVAGSGEVPEIDVKGNSGNSITDGDTACGTDDTNFGNADIATGEVTKTFTIYNGGVGNLKLSGNPLVNITGADKANFTITQPDKIAMPGNISTTFTVKFNPATTGEKTATLSIANNDSDEGTYDFSIKGTGTAVSEMDVKGKGVSIADGDADPGTADDTDFGTADVNGGSVEKTFTIANTGSAVLNLSGSPIVTSDNTDFAIAQPTANTVGTLTGEITFQVTFDPSAGGDRTATISIANDDSNENPYTFKIKGTGAVPEIDVKGNSGASITDGDTACGTADTDLGNADIATGEVTKTFTIANTGDGALSLSGTPIVEKTGAGAADFTVTQPATTTIAAGDNTTFTVKFNPDTTGVKTATISIANNDSNEGPFDFSIQGTGTAVPEMDVKGKGVSIADGDVTPSTTDDTDFGATDIDGGSLVKTFTIANTGSAVLNLNGGTLITVDNADFAITQPTAGTVAALTGAITFQVTFDPSTAGERTAIISIANDDSDENPYNFSIQGTGTVTPKIPEMDVKGNGNSIADGDVTPSTTDDTDFGATDVAGESIVRTFTIANTGSAVLHLNGGTPVTVDNADFTITQPTANTVSAWTGEITFQVTFNPTAAGERTAIISIANDDSDENPYNFSIQGTATVLAPELSGFTWAKGTAAGTQATAVPAGTLKYLVGAAGALAKPHVGDLATDYSNTLTINTDIPVVSGQHIFIVQIDNSNRILAWTDVTVADANIYAAPVIVAPTASTNAANALTTTEATLNGSVNAKGASTVVTFEYGTTTAYGTEVTATPSPVTGTTDTAVNAALSGLHPLTTYHYRVKAVNAGGTTYGTDQSFTTPAVAATGSMVVTHTDGGFLLVGSVRLDAPDGSIGVSGSVTISITQLLLAQPEGFVLLCPAYRITANGNHNFQFSQPVTVTFTFDPRSLPLGVDPAIYYYDTSIGSWINIGGTIIGNTITVNSAHLTDFALMANNGGVVPAVSSSAATGIYANGATLNGTVNANNASTTVTFEYGPTNVYGAEVSAEQSPITGTTNIAVSKTLNNLSANTTYHFRVKAVNSSGINYGVDQTFTTPSVSSTGGGGGGSGSSTTPATVSSTTGSALVYPNMGGTVALGTEAQVKIPAAALQGSAPVNVTVDKVSTAPAAPSGFMMLGNIYEMKVDAQSSYKFNQPVAVTFTFDPNQVPAGSSPAIQYYDSNASQWVNLGGTVSGNTITVNVKHFTKYAVFINQEKEKLPLVPTPTVVLSDIKGHWAEAAINKLLGLEAIKGYLDGTFKPDQTITRAEFTVVLVKALKISSSTPKSFHDVSSHWAKDYISMAAGNGIINGYNQNAFGPDDPISREQMAVMIAKAAKLDTTAGGKKFADDINISSWAKDSISSAAAKNILNGYGDHCFRPQAKASRAEAVMVINKILNQ